MSFFLTEKIRREMLLSPPKVSEGILLEALFARKTLEVQASAELETRPSNARKAYK
jgi:hypothetical protein